MLGVAYLAAHAAVLLRWPSLPFWFRAAALFWAIQAANRVAYGDNSDVETWMRLERVVLATTVAAVIEASLALDLPSPLWRFQVRMGVLMAGFAFGAALLYYAHEAAEFDALAKFLFLRAKIKAACAFLAAAGAIVGWVVGAQGGHASRFALAALLSAAVVAANWWTTPAEWRLAQAAYRCVAIACCGVWVWKGADE